MYNCNILKASSLFFVFEYWLVNPRNAEFIRVRILIKFYKIASFEKTEGTFFSNCGAGFIWAALFRRKKSCGTWVACLLWFNLYKMLPFVLFEVAGFVAALDAVLVLELLQLLFCFLVIFKPSGISHTSKKLKKITINKSRQNMFKIQIK